MSSNLFILKRPKNDFLFKKEVIAITGTRTTIRACSSVCVEGGRIYLGSGTITTCCNTDNCNGTNKIAFRLPAFIGLLIIGYFLKK